MDQAAPRRGLATAPSGGEEDEQVLLRAVRRSLHVDDPERVGFYRKLLGQSEPPKAKDFDGREQRLMLMLLWGMWGTGRKFDDLDAGLRELWRHPAVVRELEELLGVLDERSSTLPAPSPLDPLVPLAVHGT